MAYSWKCFGNVGSFKDDPPEIVRFICQNTDGLRIMVESSKIELRAGIW